MKTKITIHKKTKILHISGPIKSGDEFDFADAMDSLGVGRHIINLKDCPTMNSAALGILLQYKDKIVLCHVRIGVKKLLDDTNLKKHFEKHYTLEYALDSVGGG